VHVGRAKRRRSLVPHYVRDMMGMVLLMNVTGVMACVGGCFVIGTMGVAGTGTVKGILHAAVPAPAEKAMVITALGAAVESGPWLRRRRWALAVAAPLLAPFHP
jgi:hypothetical protein